jgi:Rps23 Pro-64 3,4-dihydroxylase Tpa1-like proline 4-hydroxylase
MDESEQNIKESIIPRGNRLVIMDVSELLRQRMNYHFISPVSITADHPRYSLAGWFYQKDSDGPSPVVNQ